MRIFQAVCALSVAVALPAFAGSAGHSSAKAGKATVNQLRQADLKTLRTQGVQVIQMGETYRLVVPTSRLFNPRSANFHRGSYRVLKTVTRFLNTYHIVAVRVAAYTDRHGSRAFNHALTDRQATVVQSYLSKRGLKVRLIYADGQGAKHAVANNYSWAGRHANRRVEISFMYLPTITMYG